MVQFGYTILYVQDVAASIAFYEQAFGLERRFITPENDYGELQTGATTIAFASQGLANTNLKNGFIESNPDARPFAMELGFVTQDVAAAVTQALQSGAKMVQEPMQKPWGQTVAYVRDIDGFLIELCTPVKL